MKKEEENIPDEAGFVGGCLIVFFIIFYCMIPYQTIVNNDGWSFWFVVWFVISIVISLSLFVLGQVGKRQDNEELKALKKKLDNAMRERETLKQSKSSSIEQIKKSPQPSAQSKDIQIDGFYN